MNQFSLKSKAVFVAVFLLTFLAALAQTPQLFTPSGLVNGSTSSGGVGIGTTSPLYELDINVETDIYNSSIHVSDSAGFVGIGTNSPQYGFDIRLETSFDNGLLLVEPAFDRIRIGANSPASVVFVDATSTQFGTALYVKNGNVGIANSNPAYDLDVDGELSVYGNSLFVNTDGVGVGTYSPEFDLDVAGDARIDGGTSTRLYMEITGNAAINFGDIPELQPDATIGYTHGNTSLYMSTISGDTDRFYMNSSGQVGINTTSFGTSELFKVAGNCRLGLATNDYIQIGTFEKLIDLGSNSLATNVNFLPETDNIRDLGTSLNRWDDVYATNGVIQTSDRRTKEDIQDLAYGLEEVMALRPVSFLWKDKMQHERKLGLIAQEVQPILDEVVKEKDYHLNEEGEMEEVELERLGVYYADIIPVLIKAIQEQQVLIDAQAQELEDVKAMINSGSSQSSVSPASTVAASQLFQNRPNPFSQSTEIPYFLADDVQQAQIMIYDINTGSALQTFDLQERGHGHVSIEGSQLSAGAYVYSLIINGKTQDSRVFIVQ